MVVDIGGGTTECAVISLGGIVWNESLKVAGDVFTSDIQQYLRQQYNIRVGEITAEKIKIAVGAAIPELETPPEPYIAKGPNLMTAYPVEVPVTSMEIAHCLDKSIAKLETMIVKVLEQTPPELAADIADRGIVLTGGGSLLHGLEELISEKTGINTMTAEDPMTAVAIGTGKYVEFLSGYKGDV